MCVVSGADDGDDDALFVVLPAGLRVVVRLLVDVLDLRDLPRRVVVDVAHHAGASWVVPMDGDFNFTMIAWKGDEVVGLLRWWACHFLWMIWKEEIAR